MKLSGWKYSKYVEYLLYFLLNIFKTFINFTQVDLLVIKITQNIPRIAPMGMFEIAPEIITMVRIYWIKEMLPKIAGKVGEHCLSQDFFSVFTADWSDHHECAGLGSVRNEQVTINWNEEPAPVKG